ncbi:beta-galactosidase [Polaribacter sp. KT25b]|uniref:T9SS type A sorting domain-containing protein n=1 Tax=Polaribacter sp. KT25b TaxID=1855336 RepID=UPI00087D1D6A|nr:T9SS type A sorting domain-containing protein [Polaribacter sp. KT25b]SDR70327.1 beta-galactosidase [Polaribacter sp. KT25b]
MRAKNILISLFFTCFLINGQVCFGQLEQTALNKISELNTLITQAENSNIDVLKEKMTVRTAEVFLEYANWDENNIAENTDYFLLVNIYKDTAAQMATDLPNYERSEINLMLDEAIVTLNKLLKGEISRKPSPKIDWTNITIDGNQVIHNGKPVFLSDYTWKPAMSELTEYFGNKDGFFISPSHVLDASGSLNSNIINELKSKETGSFGSIFLNHKNVKDWAETTYGPDFIMREDTFTGYDIDNPGAKIMQDFLLGGTIPFMKNKKYADLGYMLCNEPHFFTTKDVWATGPVSNYTIDKFKIWLSEKHQTIANLNTIWNTNFSNFNDVTINMPIEGNLLGTAIWYDWNRFNMQRVTDWFTFLHDKVQEYDADAKSHIKIIPHFWSNNEIDSGIDLEELTALTEIIGNDAKSYNSHMWGATEPWESRYSFYWRDLSMPYDFMRSVSPNKIIYNSETHFLSTTKFRDLYLKPSYARAVYWLANLQGMNVSQSWFWSRREDGSIRNGSGKGYAGSNNQQPRIINEVESTYIDLNAFSEDIAAMQVLRKPLRIYYSKNSAINKLNHMDAVFELYESLYFEGIPIGFATQKIITEQDNSNWDAILIYKTEFTTTSELEVLQTYLDNGGTIIKDAISLTKNEYGVAHSFTLNASNGKLLNGTTYQNIANQGLSIVSDNNELPVVSLFEENSLNKKGAYYRAYKNNEDENIISIINLGKENTTITLNLTRNNNPVNITNLLTGESLSSTFLMKPDAVYLLKVEDAVLATENLNKSKLKFYPNPTSNIVNFSSETTIKKATIYNTLGQEIKSIKGISNQLYVDLTELKKGVYFIKIDSLIGSKTISIIKK